jgi:DNA polymerase-3 subunit delta
MMTERKPSVYLLYGDDGFAMEAFLKQLHERLGDPTTAGMNSQVFDLPDVDLSALEAYCTSMPFLAHRRLAILKQLGRMPSDEHFQEEFFSLLERLPEHAALVLVDEVEFPRWNSEERYQKSSPVYQWASDHPERSYIQRCAVPHGSTFVEWIVSHCKELGGEIDHAAAHLLADLVSEDSHLAHQELSKLLDYVDLKRPILVDDVERLTPFRSQSDIFAMVDAIGHRDGKTALRHLHRLMEEEDPRRIFPMVIRQFRLIIQAREAFDFGLDPKRSLPHRTPDFVIKKISTQAQNFLLHELERIYRDLLDIDLASKTGGPSLEVALDRFIAELTNVRRPQAQRR